MQDNAHIFKTKSIFKGLLIIAFLFTSSVCKAQVDTTTRNYFLSLHSGYGFIMPHHKSIEYNIKDHIRPLSMRAGFCPTGKKEWHRYYRFPEIGLGFYGSNLGNDEIYGFSYALYSYFKSPFISRPKWHLDYEIAFGLSWLTEQFDVENNYQNIAIGSSTNIYFDAGLMASFRLHSKLYFLSGLQFIHFSNGKITSPNKGLNVVTSNIGLQYFFREKSYKKDKRTQVQETRYIPTNYFQGIYAHGIKSISRMEDGYFYASSLSLEYHRKYNRKYNWGLGLDLFYDGTSGLSENKTSSDLSKDFFQMGLHASHDLMVGRIAMIMQVGGYLWLPGKAEAPIYNRIGLRYTFDSGIIANLSLKSHYAQASFIEFGVGYQLEYQ